MAPLTKASTQKDARPSGPPRPDVAAADGRSPDYYAALSAKERLVQGGSECAKKGIRDCDGQQTEEEGDCLCMSPCTTSSHLQSAAVCAKYFKTGEQSGSGTKRC